MTAVLDSRHDLLTQRLQSLRVQREQALADIAPPTSGDTADRATNVDAHVQLAMLDDRIATVELALTQAGRRTSKAATDVVAIDDVVIVDFGDGPERYLLAAVEQAGADLDVITPDSPLGRALVGRSVGSTVEYRAARRTLRATVVAVD
jgi:transcription elongation factor GreA